MSPAGAEADLKRETIAGNNPFLLHVVVHAYFRESKPKFLSPNSYSTMAEITPTTSLVVETPETRVRRVMHHHTNSRTVPPCCGSVYLRLMWTWKNQRRRRTRRGRLKFIIAYRLEAHTAFGRDNIYYILYHGLREYSILIGCRVCINS